MARNFVGLSIRKLVLLHVLLHVLEKVKADEVIDHGVFQGT
jgi:hypothetical protein